MPQYIFSAPFIYYNKFIYYRKSFFSGNFRVLPIIFFVCVYVCVCSPQLAEISILLYIFTANIARNGYSLSLLCLFEPLSKPLFLPFCGPRRD